METDHFDRLSDRRGDCSATEKVIVCDRDDRSVYKKEFLCQMSRLSTDPLHIFSGGAAVDEVGDGDVRDAGVGGEADLAGTAVGVADRDAFDLVFELAEGVLVEFRVGHSFVAGETAAAYAFWNNHVGGAHAGKFKHLAGLVHQTHRAGEMNGYRGVGLVEVQPVGQETKDEFRRFVEPHLLDLVLHTMKAGALVAKDRVAAFLAGFPKCILEFLGLSVSDFGHSFAFPDRAAAKGRHILREYDLVACFAQQRHHLLDKRLVHGVVMLRKAHHLVDAAREIDHLADGRCSCGRFGCL